MEKHPALCLWSRAMTLWGNPENDKDPEASHGQFCSLWWRSRAGTHAAGMGERGLCFQPPVTTHSRRGSLALLTDSVLLPCPRSNSRILFIQTPSSRV